MNLATARSEKRAREVGVRKVLGAAKKMLVGQFIGEAIFMSLLAVFVSLVMLLLLLPAFNTLVEKQLILQLSNPVHLLALVLIVLICGLVAGSYPALYLFFFQSGCGIQGHQDKKWQRLPHQKGIGGITVYHLHRAHH